MRRNDNRDLLLVSKKDMNDAAAMKNQIIGLNKMLYSIENIHTYCTVNEIFDLNWYKIIRKPHLIQQMIRERNFKPFVFVINKN